MLDRLRRTVVSLQTNREGAVAPEPAEVLNGPMVALLNHWSASDGDVFPYYFRRMGLGKLIGTRSWGGVRGIRGDWRLMDGGYITSPGKRRIHPRKPVGGRRTTVSTRTCEIENQPADLLGRP